MSTINFHTRLKAKVLIFIGFFYLCFGESIDFSKITNLTIQEPKLLDTNDSQKWKALCKQWTFSQEKLKAFLKLVIMRNIIHTKCFIKLLVKFGEILHIRKKNVSLLSMVVGLLRYPAITKSRFG